MESKPGDSTPKNQHGHGQEVRITDRNFFSLRPGKPQPPPDPEVAVTQLEALDMEARIAACLIERWGLVAAQRDGEDSAGRARLRKLTPQELVAEACETAQLACDEFRRRGWVLQLPTHEEAVALLEIRRGDREATWAAAEAAQPKVDAA